MADGAKIVITADDAQVREAMQRVQNVVQESMGQIQGHFATFTAGFAKVNAIIAVATAALAGGKVFKESVDQVKNMTIEGVKLGKALGISAEEANVLNTALGNVFLDKDTYIDATKVITKNLNSNGKAFEDLGIKTKDAQGNLLPMQQIIGNTAGALMQFKEGADRNVMANQLLGKSWSEVLELAKLTPEVMADAAKEVKDYHKELDPAVVQRYRASMENAGDMFEGIKIAIGKSVMPALTAMGEWLSDIGPGLVEVMIEVMSALEAAFDAVAQVVKFVWDIVKDVFSGIAGAISACFGGESITTLQFFVNCVKVIQVAFIGLRIGIELAIELIKACLAGLVENVIRVAVSVSKALLLDFDGAKEAWRQGTADMAGIVEESGKRMVDIATKGNEDIQKALLPTEFKTPKSGSTEPKGGNRKAVAIGKQADDKNPSRAGDWETELTEKKAYLLKQLDAEGNARTMSLVAEKYFWEEKLTHTVNGSNEQKAVKKKVAEAELAIENEKYETGLATYKTDLAAAKNSMLEKVAIAEKMAAYVAQHYGKESKQYQEAKRQIIQIEQQATEQIIQIQEMRNQRYRDMALAKIDLAEAQAQLEVALGRKTQNEMLADERQFAAQRYAIQRQALEEKKAQYQEDPVKYAQIIAALEALDQGYALKKKQNQIKQAQQDMKYWNSLESGMSSMFESGLNKMLAKQLKFKDALKQVWGELGKLFLQNMVIKPAAEYMALQVKLLAIDAWAGAKKLAIAGAVKAKELALDAAAGVKKAAIWVWTEGAMTAATIAGNIARTASNWAAAVASVAASVWAALKNIMISAWEAMAGAFTAMCAIPVVGPALGVGAGIAAFALVAGLAGNVASARGGYDIPAGVNPMTQLHEQEMVLPKPYANVIRDLASGGGNTSGSSDGGVSNTVNYVDNTGKLSRDQIRQNARIIAEELSKVTKRGWSPA